ncbi:putative PEP-CTERM system histidine kinase [Noviherbaspirillum humi]|uniref:histidine kinase n=1 Tax=Noviherbaspirillum humi TaxID=1688639 RepID=A0A239HIF0_9BURK|nr:XrtA/PEP-CTERM system histidine kinase PrsK [Noviherbaspirillum humi]SNS81186.1 putative PEP-CTERM system histidine kinase [Noviherbaspirillum humi]
MVIDVALVSYGIAALAFALLSIGLLATRQQTSRFLLLIACLTAALWAGMLAWPKADASTAARLVPTAELARDVAWLMFLLSLQGSLAKAGETRRMAAGISGFALLAAAISLWQANSDAWPLLQLLSGAGAYVCLSIIGMLLVEQVLRSASLQQRWGIKFACLGIGGIFVFDFYLYSEAMLFRQINPGVWSARGIINALIVPMIAVSAHRSAKWATTISVSRRFLFHSVALFGAGLYLLAMAAAGYYLRYVGGNWGSFMQLAFLFGALLLLGTVMFSGAFRARIRVFLSKHFFAYSYDYREEWMQFTRTLAKADDSPYQRTIEAIANLVESPGGALWIRRETGQCEPAGHWNTFSSTAQEPAQGALCCFLEQHKWIIDLQEWQEDPVKYQNLALPGWLLTLPDAWLVVPLIVNAKLLGFIVLARPRSPIALNWEVLDLLKIAGSQAGSYLAQYEAAQALLVARQFDSYHRMSTFVVHDLKNLVAQLSLLVANSARHKDSPEFQQDMLETVTYSVEKMKTLLQRFNRSKSAEAPQPVALDAMLKQIVNFRAALHPGLTMQISASGMSTFGNASRLERVIAHFVTNAIEATPKDGRITLSIERDGMDAVIVCADTGQGMSEEFIRERLFKPFVSTKSTGMGIGIFEAREYIHELGGSIAVASAVSHGTTFRIRLPIYVPQSVAADVTNDEGVAGESAETEITVH